MSSQINVFTNLAILLVTIWIVFYAWHAWKTWKKPYLKWFFVYTLTLLFFASHRYVWRYICINLIPGAMDNLDPLSENFNDLVFSLVALGSVVMLFRVVFGIHGREFRRPVWWAIRAFAGVVIVGYGARALTPWGMKVFGWFDTVATYVTIRVWLYEFIPAALALYFAYRETDSGRRVLLRGFGWFFLAGPLARGTLTPLWKAGLTGIPFEVIFITVVLFATLIPYLWLRYVVVARISMEYNSLSDPVILESVADRYNISNREREVIRLILDGKSNKEIQDSLFVSIHTVKNHIYNIYKKLGVNSRYSLIHMMTRDRDHV
jgi:DNA-binding CsgD family transcriptional regulator